MPRGIPNTPKLATTSSENTKRLLEAMAELQARIDAERAKDRARVMLVHFAQKHELNAQDLRAAARTLGDRKVGDAPAVSKNFNRAKAKALGAKLREARLAKELTGAQLNKLVGAKGTAAALQWEKGMLPSLQLYRDGLIHHLGLPKDFFADAPPPNMRGTKGTKGGNTKAGKANGHGAHAP